MAPSNKNKTAQDKALAAKRVEFVKSKPDLAPEEARTRFFVQTRAAELQAKGVEVTKAKRQELRQKFATGGVQRQGFYTPADLAKIAARNSAGAATGSNKGDSTITPSPVGSGANLADVKTTGDQAVRMGRAAAQPKNVLGISNKFENALKNPAADFLGSPVGRLVKGAYKMAEQSAESLNATFINPTVNLAGKGLNWLSGEGDKAGYNPKLRVAGPKEAAFNTAMVLIDIASAGQTAAARAATGPVISEALAARASTLGPGKVQSIINNVSNKAGQMYGRRTADSFAGAFENAAGRPGTVGNVSGRSLMENLGTKVENVASKAKTTTTKKTGQAVTGIEDYVSSIKYPKGGKTGSVDLATGEYIAPKVGPKSSAKSGPKLTPKNEAAGKAFNAKVETIKNTPTPAPVVRPPAVKSSVQFGSQNEYNVWLSKGGKFKLQQMSNAERESFLATNKNWVSGKGQAVEAVNTSAAQRAAKAARRNKRYQAAVKRGSPMAVTYNKIVTARATRIK